LLKQGKIESHFKHIHYTHIIKSNSKISIYLNTIYRFILISTITLLNKNFSISIIGNYLKPVHRYFQFICSKVPQKITHFIVDDGTSTIRFANSRVEEINEGISKIRIHSHVDSLLFSFLLIKRNYIPPNLTFYTIYDIANNALDNVMFNEYNYLRKNAITETKIESDSIIIIGQCLVEENILSETDYKDYVNYLIDINLGKSIYYVPHPGEKHNYIRSIGSISVLSPGLPVEMILVNLPSTIKVFGFYSSALYNLKKIEPIIEIYSLVINARHISDSYLVQEIGNIYLELKKIGIKLIEKAI